MNNLYTDTIVAPATTPGTGAISIVRTSGPDCFKIVDAVVKINSTSISKASGYTIHYGDVYLPDGKLLDEVLVSVYRAPHSYTGEDSVEISTHASSYIVNELVHLLTEAGARFAEPGEFTRRAFLNGKMDLAQAEAVADVISSTTSASHRVAMNQLKGSFSKELEELREQLLEMASLLELELDFSEEDVKFAPREKLLELTEKTVSHTEKLSSSFRQGNMIKNGVPVAIIGAANAGKSTLLNALLGEDRAIVSDIPGTTRDTIEETLNIGGILFRFIDTAGIRASEDSIEKLGIERTFRKISEAETVLALVDISENEFDLLKNIQSIFEHVGQSNQKLFILLNKTDKIGPLEYNKNVTIINSFVSSSNNKADIIELSAKTGEGLDKLKEALYKSENGLIANADSTFVTNIRHYEALVQATSALRQVHASLLSGTPTYLVAEDLRNALLSINLILGKDLNLDAETILHRIFQSHCIGK